jgi:hypothetical protein
VEYSFRDESAWSTELRLQRLSSVSDTTQIIAALLKNRTTGRAAALYSYSRLASPLIRTVDRRSSVSYVEACLKLPLPLKIFRCVPFAFDSQ